ncbi:phosphoesterase [Microbacterium phage Zooman]|nr:phosphoesterase [Microbacterium phage Zooman]
MPNIPLPEGVKETDLRYFMLNTPLLDVSREYGKDLNEDDYFYGDIPELKYAKGPVAETKAHLTLLGGIHPSPDYKRMVDAVLRGWKPEDVFVDHVSFFPSRIEGQDYNTVIAKVSVLPNLLEGNARLQVLDHTTQYEFKPHITLAYIKGSADLPEWIKRMDEAFGGRTFEVTGYNYGDD